MGSKNVSKSALGENLGSRASNDTFSELPVAGPAATVQVWDGVVRVGHWSLVAMIAVAWISRNDSAGWLHEWSGIAAFALVSVRIFWGLRRGASRFVRFSEFISSPRNTLSYARRMMAGSEPRYLGHNPLGAWMILALLATVSALAVTGWLYTTDAFWGAPWLDLLHGWLANALVGLAAVHVAGVIHTSFRHRENLLAAMVHGRKRDSDNQQRPRHGDST